MLEVSKIVMIQSATGKFFKVPLPMKIESVEDRLEVVSGDRRWIVIKITNLGLGTHFWLELKPES